MTDHNPRIVTEIEKTIKLQNADFELVSDMMREQLEVNRATINEFESWNKNADFKIQNLKQLIIEQKKLTSKFDDNWNYKVINPHNLLKFDHIYVSQIFIIIEWHAGISFNHLLRRYIMFNENGFFKTTTENLKRDSNEIINRIENIDYNYMNLYEVDKDLRIKFKLDKEDFNGKIIHEALVGWGYQTW